jgi:hypothetical protein
MFVAATNQDRRVIFRRLHDAQLPRQTLRNNEVSAAAYGIGAQAWPPWAARHVAYSG